MSNCVEPNKCTHKKSYENIYLSVSYNFSNFDGSKKIKVWWFLMIPSKETLTLLFEQIYVIKQPLPWMLEVMVQVALFFNQHIIYMNLCIQVGSK
jgi:hypothetical protein